MAQGAWEYDVFISYAHADQEWVERNIYYVLQGLRRVVDGLPPRIFLDRSRAPGQNVGASNVWTRRLSEAIYNSHRFLPIYSRAYFESEVCLWELEMAQSLDFRGTQGRLVPILMEPQAAECIPFQVSLIHYIDASQVGWTEHLTSSLDLRGAPQQEAALVFADQPSNIAVNHTLPSIRVDVPGDDGDSAQPPEVSISCEGSHLQGTLRVAADSGRAVFTDLTPTEEVRDARLVATAPGYAEARSNPFAVLGKREEAPVPEDAAEVQVMAGGRPVFFRDAASMCLVGPDGIAVYGADGALLSPRTSGGFEKVAFVRSGNRATVVGRWDGTIHLALEDGRVRTEPLCDDRALLSVPSDAFVGEEHAYVGFWDGRVWELPRDGDYRVIFKHRPGVRSLAVSEGRVFVLGFDDAVGIYHASRQVGTFTVDDQTSRLLAIGSHVLAVGPRRLQRTGPRGQQLLFEDAGLDGEIRVYADSDHPVIVSDSGVGYRFDGELAKSSRFHVAARSTPISADRAGRFATFSSPDGSWSLVCDGKVVLHRVAGPLAVDPAGERLALGDAASTRVVPLAAHLAAREEAREHV